MPAVPPQPKTGGLGRRLARLLRRKRTPSGAEMAYSVAGDEFDQSLMDSSINSLSKLKLSGNLAAAYSFDALFKKTTAEKTVVTDDASKQAFVASLFAGASAVKAAYAQLQLAQHPYDAEAVQAADAGLVTELRKLSDLKRRYARDPAATCRGAAALASQAEEQRHLLRTYEVTARKLEAELHARDAEADRARAALAEAEERRPGLAALHLSGLNATHFLTALRHAARSVGAFARSMLRAMDSAGWDPVAAALAVHPGVQLRRPGDARLAVESYVALKMFAGFQMKDLGLSSLRGRGCHDRRRFFADLKSLDASGGSSGAFRDFLRERYLSLVHEKMEASFFAGRGAEQRAAVAAGDAFPRTPWFAEFAEMGRRVWLLHCLLHAFDCAASVFQARPGSRFSEVYMESVVGEAEDHCAVVGFTVVPGFKVGQTVIQCRVYLSRPDGGEVSARQREAAVGLTVPEAG
jgi:hypothetical protein